MENFTNELGHMERWPASLYIVKTFKNILLQNQWTDGLETWYVASGTKIVLIRILGYLKLFTAMSNMGKC